MRLSRAEADIYVPDGSRAEAALARTTHLSVGAHQDDIEIMAQSGIAECYAHSGRFFTGVTATDGAGSPRAGSRAAVTDEQMRIQRRAEQRRAAEIGRYNLQLQLAHPSADWKKPGHAGIMADLSAIFGGCRPEVVYLHNPADKHDTHVAVLLRCLEALRALPAESRPSRVLGCEVWRDLDWLVDADKVPLDAGQRPELAEALLKAFESQIGGGKRYDLAVLGRRAAHATFYAPREADKATAVVWAMDLTPLVANPALSVRDFTLAHLDRLRDDVASRLERFSK